MTIQPTRFSQKSIEVSIEDWIATIEVSVPKETLNKEATSVHPYYKGNTPFVAVNPFFVGVIKVFCEAMVNCSGESINDLLNLFYMLRVVNLGRLIALLTDKTMEEKLDILDDYNYRKEIFPNLSKFFGSNFRAYDSEAYLGTSFGTTEVYEPEKRLVFSAVKKAAIDLALYLEYLVQTTSKEEAAKVLLQATRITGVPPISREVYEKRQENKRQGLPLNEGIIKEGYCYRIQEVVEVVRYYTDEEREAIQAKGRAAKAARKLAKNPPKHPAPVRVTKVAKAPPVLTTKRTVAAPIKVIRN